MHVWLWLVWGAFAADVPFFRPESIISGGDATACPDLPEGYIPGTVNTTLGLFQWRDDGSYAWICPDAYGDDGTKSTSSWAVQGASDLSGQFLMVLFDGVLNYSEDAGCTFNRLVLPTNTLVIRDVIYWQQQFFVLAVDLTAGNTSLLRYSDTGLGVFKTLENFIADDIEPGGAGALWISGARPVPTLYRLGFEGGLHGFDAPVPGLPSDAGQYTSLSIPAALSDEVWLRFDGPQKVALWYGERENTGVVVLSAGSDDIGNSIFRTVFGPVRSQDVWLVDLDGGLYTAPHYSSVFSSLAQSVPWTGMHMVGERVFTSTPDGLFALTGYDESLKPRTVQVLSALQLTSAATACETPACAGRWSEVLTSLGRDAEAEPAACPDGRTLEEINRQACTCNSAAPTPLGAGLFAGLLAWMGTRRRRSRLG